ncbi:MAG: hypothetical protein ACREXJ_16695 [Gammaproteobacteria bacterium]
MSIRFSFTQMGEINPPGHPENGVNSRSSITTLPRISRIPASPTSRAIRLKPANGSPGTNAGPGRPVFA